VVMIGDLGMPFPGVQQFGSQLLAASRSNLLSA
jgi:hypothetical protein